MEEGSLRCDANVSVRPRGQKKFGTKTEIKNVNSFRFIREALEYEIERQIDVIESGGKITQETRLYNADEGKTYSMRSKEQAHDYRYFPEPDLLPLVVDETWRAEIARTLPELPEARRARLVKHYGITEYDAASADMHQIAGRPVRGSGEGREESQARRQPGAGRIDGPAEGQGSRDRAVADFDEGRRRLRRSGRSRARSAARCSRISTIWPSSAARISRQSTRKKAARSSPPIPRRSRRSSTKLIAANPKQLEQYRAGKNTMLGFFVGQVMKASKGQASPQLVNELLVKKLK